MKKCLLFLLIAIMSCGNVYSQAKKPAKRTSTSITAKQKAEAEAKAKAEAEEAARAEAEAAEKARLENNNKCGFLLNTGNFVSKQGNDGYVVYEIPDMSASELKSAVFTTLSSMFKSPKDAITNLSDNMIQLEGYSPSLYNEKLPSSYKAVNNHLIFNLVIQFKDGKVRYNTPTIKLVHMKVEDSDVQTTVNISGGNMREYFGSDPQAQSKLKSVEDYFNNLISTINSKLKASNDW